MTKRDKQIDGEYDRPLPDRTDILGPEEQEDLLQKTLAKHRQCLDFSNLDFLDYGLPVEPIENFEEVSRALAKFRAYCACIGKTASELSADELNEYWKRNDMEVD